MLTIMFLFLICCKLSAADSSDCYPDKQAIDSFINSLKGKVLKPGDSQYQNASTMKNIFYTRQPGMIVMAESVEDVQTSVLFAKEHNLQVTVHSTGHDFNGRSTADGSLMIDLSSMQKIDINLESSRHAAGEITVESGNTWIKIYEELQKVDRVVVGGISKTVSPGGYTLGGGHSPISRKFGLAVDQVLAMKVVVANGSIVDCTADGNTIRSADGTVESTTDTDLFWALRGGGGGTFGIVVEFTYKLHRQPEQLVSITISANLNNVEETMELAVTFLESFETLIKTLPKEYGGYLVLTNTRGRGQPKNDQQTGMFILSLVKFGPWDSETEKVWEPYNDCIKSYGCNLKIENKTDLYDYVLGATESYYNRFYTLGTFIQPEKLNQQFIFSIINELQVLSIKGATVFCGGTLIGGTVTTFSDDSAPIHPGFRSGIICMTCEIVMYNPTKDEGNIWAGQYLNNQLQKYGKAVYMNEAMYDLENWQEAFWGHHYKRLQRIKRDWDPDNFFTCHHCVGSETQTVRKTIKVCDE